MALRLAVLFLWLSTMVVSAQPVYEAACSVLCTACGSTSIVCTAVGSNRLAVVGESHYSESANVDSITYGGADLSGSLVATHFVPGLIEENLYRVINPAASAQTLAVSIDAAGQLRFGALLISGAHQTTPLGTPVAATGVGTTMSATVTTAADELVVALANSGEGDATLSPGTNETERWSATASEEGETAMYTQPGASGGVMTPTQSAAVDWLIIAVSVKPAAAAVPDTYQMRRRF